MKKLIGVMLIVVFVGKIEIVSGAPKYPFPQKKNLYKYGILPSSIDDTKVQKAFDDFMKLYEENGDLARIKWDTEQYTVSEGIG
ncbi:MAG: hypothetical protein N2053_12695, partial [Chitinispirillaceae bacterium]|nr:hypothetical protein [Chitinispirillaceae bacterium]